MKKILFLTMTTLFVGCHPSTEMHEGELSRAELERLVSEQGRAIHRHHSDKKWAYMRGGLAGVIWTGLSALFLGIVWSNKRAVAAKNLANPGIFSLQEQQYSSPPSSTASPVARVELVQSKPPVPKVSANSCNHNRIVVDVASVMRTGDILDIRPVLSLWVALQAEEVVARFICCPQAADELADKNPSQLAAFSALFAKFPNTFVFCRNWVHSAHEACGKFPVISNNRHLAQLLAQKRNVPVREVEVHSVRIKGNFLHCRFLGNKEGPIHGVEISLRIARQMMSQVRIW